MVDFIVFESVSTTAHLASLCQAAYIGSGSVRMASMQSSSANWLLVTDTQQQVAASRRVLRIAAIASRRCQCSMVLVTAVR